MITNDIVVALTGVFECFEALGLRYYIGGSLASTAHGKGRMTQDADELGVDDLLQRVDNEAPD